MPLGGVAEAWQAAFGFRKAPFVFSAFLLLSSIPALAQGVPPAAPAPSQVTPQNIAPPQNAPPPSLTITGAPTAKPPAGAENLRVTVGMVVMDDGYPDMAAATERLVAPYRGRNYTVAQLYDLAAAIEGAYAAKGYILARVVVPPQTLRDGGDLHLKLIDGFIENVDVSHVPAAVAGPIAARLQGLVGLRRPRLAQIERALTLAGTVPGVQLKSTLAPGKEEGGTQMVIEAVYSPIGGSVTANNSLGPLFNDWQVNFQFFANSLLGLGEQIYLYVSGSPELGRAFDGNAKRRVAGGGIAVPIGDDGFIGTLEGTIADTKPFVPGAFFQSDGLFKRLDAKFSYPLQKSRAESLTLGGTFEYSVQTEVAHGFGVVLDEDRVNVARLSLEWNRSFDGLGDLDLFGQVSQGLTWFNVRTIADVIATGAGFSRFGTTPNFSKAEFRLSYNREALPYGLSIALQLRGQYAFNHVVPSSELFSLDGQDAVSTLTSGALSGDNGMGGRFELARPLPADTFLFTPYLYFSGGRAFSKFETPGVPIGAVAWGAGLRASHEPVLGVTPQLSVEAGHVNAGLASANRVMVNLGVNF